MVVSQIRAIVIPAVIGIGIVSAGTSVVAFQFGGGGTANVTEQPTPTQNKPQKGASQPPQSKPQLSKPPVQPGMMGGGMGGGGEFKSESKAQGGGIRSINLRLQGEIAERDNHPKTPLLIKRFEEPITMSFPNETPLEDLLKYIQSVALSFKTSGIPIYVDPVGLQEAEKTLMSPVTIKLEGVPLKSTLKLVLKQLGLTYTVQDGFLKITNDASADEPHDSGGATLKDLLLLRKLEDPISMDFSKETPIQDVLKYVQSATSGEIREVIPIYVDPIGLQEAEKTLQSPVKMKLDGVPLKTTLRLALRQLGLAYCIHDGLVFISTDDGVYDELADVGAELGIPVPPKPSEPRGSHQ